MGISYQQFPSNVLDDTFIHNLDISLNEDRENADNTFKNKLFLYNFTELEDFISDKLGEIYPYDYDDD